MKIRNRTEQEFRQKQYNQFEMVLRDTGPENKTLRHRDSGSPKTPTHTPGGFPIFPPKADTHHYGNNLEIFLFHSNTASQSPPPDLARCWFRCSHTSQGLLPSKTHCNPMVRLDPDPTSPEDSRVKCQHGTRGITREWVLLRPLDYPSYKHFLDSWILGFLDFFGVGGPTPQGLEVAYHLVQWLRQRRITQRVSQSNFWRALFGRLIWRLSYLSGGAPLIPGRYVPWKLGRLIVGIG